MANKNKRLYYTLVNILTLMRILVLPIVGLLIYNNTYMSTFWAFNITIFACITDWLDGTLARRFDLGSNLGRMLDPIADKLLVIGALIFVLIWRDETIWIEVAALCIIAREIIVSGLREHMAKQEVTIHVTFLAKTKTTVQCVGIVMLISKPLAYSLLWFSDTVLEAYYFLTTVVLVVAAILAIISAYSYIATYFHSLVKFNIDD